MNENAFQLGLSIERRSRDILEPLLEQATNGRFVYTDKGRLAKQFQKTTGDLLIQEHKKGGMWAVEMKAEEKSSRNLFLEVWSNGSRYTTGWMFHLQADLLFYHFLDADMLYILKLQHLRQWFFFGKSPSGHFKYKPGYLRYEMKRQSKYSQLNDTWGSCVPLDVLQKEVKFKVVRPLGLFGLESVA